MDPAALGDHSRNLDDYIRQKIVKVERRRDLSYQQFLENYVRPRRPVILENSISHWPALSRWTPAFFRDLYGSRKVKIDGKDYTLGEVVDLAEKSELDNPAPYYKSIILEKEYPELMEDITPYPDVFQPNWFHAGLMKPLRRLNFEGGDMQFFLGGKGRSFPNIHFDLPCAHSFITQIAGKKLIILYSPADTPYIYPTSDVQFFVSRIKSIDKASADKFPLFATATRYDAELSPGEIVFMPGGWWHTAKMLSFSISVGLDVANSTNWRDITAFMRRYYKRRRPIIGKFVLAYFHLIGLLMPGGDNEMRH